MKENEMGGRKKLKIDTTKFWPENLKGRDHLEDLNIHSRVILE
jgi:hypothetical protein